MFCTSGCTPFYTCHFLYPVSLNVAAAGLAQAVWRPFLDCPSIRITQFLGAAVLADIFAVMAHQTVALAGYAVLDLTGCGDLEAFLHTTFSFQLGHFGLL